jgi:two-component system sensor histidine kinase/response regulator
MATKPAQISEIDDLKEQLIKKDKIIDALKDRVKQSIQKSGDAYAIFERNIVLQDLVEEQTKDLHAAAHKAEAGSKAKSDFLAQMSHEIRTPLNVITGMSHLLFRTELTEEQKGFISNIKHSSHSLLRIINDVLDISKIEAGKVSLEHIGFSLKTVIDTLASVFSARSGDEEVEVLYDIAPNIPEVLVGDPLRLEQVLSNLCSNALKFTDKGQIIVRAKVKALNTETVELQFSVQDSGIGIDKKQAGKLFQPFNQADDYITRKYGGTGLGLSICKHLVAEMQGKIWLESEQGLGSTFFFTAIFDCAETNMARTEIDSHYRCITFTENFSVLVVDDSELNLEIISEMLKDMDLEVFQAKSGKEAIELIANNKYDLVFMDIQMPLMDGLEVTTIIRQDERFNSLPIVAMTAHAMDYDEQKSFSVGMQGHLTKPIDAEILEQTIIGILTAIHGDNIYSNNDLK